MPRASLLIRQILRSLVLGVSGRRALGEPKIAGQWTISAIRRSPAMSFADGDGQRMHLIEQPGAIGGRIGSECFSRKFDERIVTFAPGRRRRKAMAKRNAPKILVRHRDWMIKSIEQDSVRGLRTYAGKSKQPEPKRCGRCSCEQIERARKFIVDHGDKCFQRRPLPAMKTARTNKRL